MCRCEQTRELWQIERARVFEHEERRDVSDGSRIEGRAPRGLRRETERGTDENAKGQAADGKLADRGNASQEQTSARGVRPRAR